LKLGESEKDFLYGNMNGRDVNALGADTATHEVTGVVVVSYGNGEVKVGHEAWVLV
jgi:hypothetical protein